MDDDFNTPEALAVLFELARQINRLRSQNLEEAGACAAILRKLATVLGLLQQDPASYLQSIQSIDETLRVKIEQLVIERVTARKNKDWARADQVRAELIALGVSLEDTAEGTLWRL
jgi:cysteinyl-tRNA synthetase